MMQAELFRSWEKNHKLNVACLTRVEHSANLLTYAYSRSENCGVTGWIGEVARRFFHQHRRPSPVRRIKPKFGIPCGSSARHLVIRRRRLGEAPKYTAPPP